MVGSALARMVLSIDAHEHRQHRADDEQPQVLVGERLGSRRLGASIAPVTSSRADCSGFSSSRMMAMSATVMRRRDREEHPPVGFRRHRGILRQRAAELAGAAGSLIAKPATMAPNTATMKVASRLRVKVMVPTEMPS